MNVLEVSHISKRFGDKEVLGDVSFNVPENCIFGFIGRNGAGKTTTMKAILGLHSINGGEIKVCGEKVVCGNSPTNKHIGYLPDVPEFYGFMNAAEYLKLCGEITGMNADDIKKCSSELLELVGLSGEKHRIKGYSRGMKQRLGIAQALLNRPKLLICDEPTSALDPVGRREILDILLSAKEQTSVLFSTHILSDVERICSDIAILEGGKIVLGGTIDELKKRRKSQNVEIVPLNKKPDDIKNLFPDSKTDGDKLVVRNVSQNDFDRLLRIILENHIEIDKIERQEMELEQLFMEVIEK